jgi:hypothetical protein
MMEYTCSPNFQEAEAGGLLEPRSSRPDLSNTMNTLITKTKQTKKGCSEGKRCKTQLERKAELVGHGKNLSLCQEGL